MEASDAPKTDYELMRDARKAELAIRLQPVEAAAKTLADSLAKDKARISRKRKESSPVLPRRSVRHASRVVSELTNDEEDSMSASEETKTEDSSDNESEDVKSESDEIEVVEAAHGSRGKKQLKHPVPSPSIGLASQPPPQWQWQWPAPQSTASHPTPPSQWAMLPQPTQPAQWAMTVVPPSYYPPVQAHEVLLKSDSIGRSNRRKKQKESEKKSFMRNATGRKGNEVHVTSSGEIDASSPGKNAWDQSMRAFVPLILDLSVVEWSNHKAHTLQKLRDSLDAEFDYLGNRLNNRGFRNAVKRFLKGERCRLKKIFMSKENEGEVEGEDDCPVNIDPAQWKRLKAYWQEGAQVTKSQVMTNARKQVQNVSKMGRRGKAGDSTMLENSGSPDLMQTSEVAGSSQVFPPGIQATMQRLQSRQDAFEKFKHEILASTNRNTQAVEALQAMLIQVLEKANSTGGASETGVAVAPTFCNPVAEVTDPYDLLGTCTVEGLNKQGIQEESKDGGEEEGEPKDGGEELGVVADGKEGGISQQGDDTSKKEDGNSQEKVDEVQDGNSKELHGSSMPSANSPGQSRMQLRKGTAREKVVATKESKGKGQSSRGRKEPSLTSLKFAKGQKVELLNPTDQREIVAHGTATAVGGGFGPQKYHGQPIPKGWYRVDVVSVGAGSTPLMHANPQGDEFQLKDVVGGNTIWDEQFMIDPNSRIKLPVGMKPSEYAKKLAGK